MRKATKYIILLKFAIVAYQASAQNLYPGDANNDSIVNHIDLLNLGRSFGFSGTPRPLITNAFAPQPIPLSWGVSYYGNEIFYSDCNGDGVINENDTLAINLNYGRSYGSIPNNYYNELNPDVVIETNKDTVSLGDTLILKFTDNSVSNDVLGMAYTLNYDSVFGHLFSSFSYQTQSTWFSSVGNEFKIAKHNADNNFVDMCLVRNDLFSQDGNGDFGELRIIIEEDLLGGIMINDQAMQFELSRIVKASLNRLDTIGAMSQQVYFKNNILSIQNLKDKDFKILNVNNRIQIQNIKNYKNVELQLINIAGQKVLSKTINSTQRDFSLENIDKGVYYAIVIHDNKRLIKNIIKF